MSKEKNSDSLLSKEAFEKLSNAIPTWLKKATVPALKAQQYAFNETKFCGTVGCTNDDFQWCHVIPKGAQLNSFAESHKVCWIPMRQHDLWTLRSFWSEDPVSKTLVFRGFCNSCDSKLFDKIDRPLTLDKETYLLLAYRSTCYFNWRSEVEYLEVKKNHILTEEMVESDYELPRLKDGYERQFDSHKDQAMYRKDKIRTMMDSLRDAIESGDSGIIETRMYDFNEELPFRYSLASVMTTSLLNEHINICQLECPPLPGMFLHLLEIDGTTKLIFSWLKCIPKRYAESWIQQFERFSESGHLADILLRYMVINNHGLISKPSFVATLKPEQSFFLTKPLMDQMYLGSQPQPTLLRTPPYFDLNWRLSSID